MRVGAVVVNWNGGEENLVCLRALLEQGLAPESIAFVDNGSRDGSLERVRAAHPRLHFVCNASNLGFGAGANQGIRARLATGDEAVFLVNNDLELAPACLASLVQALEREPRLGIVGPRVLYKHERTRVWAAGGRLTFRQNLSELLGHGEPDGERWRATRAVDYVPGCAMLVRAEVFRDAGLFEADYFAYHEDVELCISARERGWHTQLVGSAAAWHTAGSSTGGGYGARRKYMVGLNTVRFLRKHGNVGRWLGFALFDVASLPLLLLVAPFRGRTRAVLAKAKGIWDGLRGKRVEASALEPGSSWLW